MARFFLIIFFVVIELNPAFSQKKLKKHDLEDLYKMMSGSFSSEAQSFRDSNYLDIRLQMKPMWHQRFTGFWLYVEQAVSNAMNKPYRQRVYHLYQLNDTCIVSQVYKIKNATQYIGAYNTDNPLDKLTSDSLEALDGCAINLVKTDKSHFNGSTSGTSCQSNLRGATYTISEVSVIKGMLISWDRGFDSNGKQVWGATQGGYMFVKIKDW